jgi:hypothetical protein
MAALTQAQKDRSEKTNCDIDGTKIDLCAVVRAVKVIPSSADSGDVLAGTLLWAESKSGAAFIVVDDAGEKHVAPAKSLRVVIPGDEDRPAIADKPINSAFGMTYGELTSYQERGVTNSSIARQARIKERAERRASGRLIGA